MANKRGYCVIYRNEANIFNNWLDTDNFMQNNKGVKQMRGFETIEEAHAWGENLLFDKTPVKVPETKSEAGQLFKLIANEYRGFTKDGNEMRIKKICLCFDKLSEVL